MHHETAKRMGLALLAAGIALRFFTASGAQPEPPKPQVWVLKVEQKQAPAEPEPVFPVFSAAEADAISLRGVAAQVDKTHLLTKPLSFETPTVLIYHTHTSEAYAQSAGWTYEESEPLRTAEPNFSVAAVGARTAEVLEARGVRVIHEATYFDMPDYNAAYRNAGRAVEQLLLQHPEVDVVLDLHRDAAEGVLRPTVTLADGRQAAKLMLVVGTDLGAGGHPDWQQNLSLALKVQASAERRQPGLCRPMDLRRERFNQFLSPGALLVEVGASGNTMPEALLAAELLAHAVADLLVGV